MCFCAVIWKMSLYFGCKIKKKKKKKKKKWQDSSHWENLGFQIRTILAIFDLHVTPMLPNKFQINWPFCSGEELKNRFSRWPPWRPSWISDRNVLSIFDLHVSPLLPTKFGVNWPLGSGEEAKNRFSRWSPWSPPLISDWYYFSNIWSKKSPQCLLPSFESIGLSVQEKKRKIDFQYGGHFDFQSEQF